MTVGSACCVFRAALLRPALIHMHDPELAPWIPILRLLKIIVVFDSHEDICASINDKPYLRGVNGRIASLLGRWLVQYIDRFSSGVVAATPAILRQFSNDKQCLVQNYPILTRQLSVSPQSKATRLVYIGAISEARGIWTMLEAVQKLSAIDGDIRLVLAGDVDQALLWRMKRHPGWAYTEYLGILDREGVESLLSRSTVGLVLFQPESNHVLSMPTKMFEYMQAGLPVLASDFPLWQRLIRDSGAGVVVDPTNVDQTTIALTTMLESPNSLADMGRLGKALVEQSYSWTSESTILLQLYEQLLPSARRLR